MLNYKSYINSEDSPWITFVHGAGGSSTIWFKQLKTFMPHFNILLVDLRGHGSSKSLHTESWRKYSFASIGDDVIEVLDYLQIEKTHFVGISLGTIIIRDLTERYPERALSLVMGGAVMELNTRCNFLMKIARYSKNFIPYMFLYKFFAFIVMPKRNHKESRNLFVNEAKKLYQNEFKKWVTLFTKLNPVVELFKMKEAAVKTLYIMGDEDNMFLPAVQKFIHRHTRSELMIIPNCGHVVNIDQPEIFNNKVLNFLKSQH